MLNSPASRSRWLKMFAAGLVLIVFLLPSGSSCLAVEAVVRHIGNAGAVKTGCWIPVVIELTGNSDQKVTVELICPDAHGDRVRFLADEQLTLSSSPQQVARTIRIGKLDATLEIVVRDASSQKVLQTQFARLSDSASTGTLRSDQSFLFNLTPLTQELWQQTNDRDDQVSITSGLSELAWIPYSLDGIDLILLKPSAEIGPEISRQLQHWVQQGGRLIVLAGPQTAGIESELFNWLPCEIGESSTLPSVSAIESFASDASRISRRSTVSARSLILQTGITLLEGPIGPLLVETVYGRGTIVVAGLDLDQAPLNSWSGLPVLLRKIVNKEKEKILGQGRSQQLSQLGINDLKTQLDLSVSADDSLPPSLWIVLGLTLVLALLIGPLDYLFCHYVCKKPELTWVTFPVFLAIAVTGCLLNYQPSGAVHRGQMTFWDIDTANNTSQLTSYFSLSEPDHKRLDLEVETDVPLDGFEVSQSTLSWSGIPEQSFGGMNRTSSLAASQTSYTLSISDLSVIQLPVLAQSRQVLQFHQSGSLSNPVVNAELSANAAGQLSGQLSHSLPGTLNGWVMVYGKRIYRPRDESKTFTSPLRPGEVWTPNSATVSQRELKGYLTGRTMRTIKRQDEIGEKLLVSEATYDPLDPNPDVLSRFVTFYQAAGGVAYTRLSNTELEALDLSHQVSLNYAVLMGRLEFNPVTVSIDRQEEAVDEHATFVRLLIPVERSETIIKELPNYDKNKQRPAGSPLRQVD